MNDAEICSLCLKVERLARTLDELQAQSKEMALFMALSDIERAANKAQMRLNDLLYGRSFNPAEEQMGT